MKKEHVLTLTILLLIFLSISFLKDDIWLNDYLKKPQGNVLLTFIGGAFFFLVQKYFDLRQAERLTEFENSQRRYNLMLDLIKTGDYYNFFTPKLKDSEGGWFIYRLKPIRNQNNEPVAFNYMQMDEHLLYVDDIAFRDQLNENVLLDYISGPLELGSAYYLRFRDGNWYLVNDTYPKSLIEIQRFGKNGPVVNKPSAIQLARKYIHDVDLSSFRNLGSFLFNKDGEIHVSSGTLAEVFIDDSTGRTFLRLGQDERSREFYITFPEKDYRRESPFIKIQLIEGFFSSSLALLNFKNSLDNFCTEKQVKIRMVDFWNSSIKGQ